MPEPLEPDGLPIRLQTYLARAGLASRRAAERLILAGHARHDAFGKAIDLLLRLLLAVTG